MKGKQKLGLFVACLMLLLIFMGLNSFTFAEVTPKADWKTYTVEKEFKVSTPASWEQLENSYLKLQVASKMEALLNIGTMPMPEGITTLEGLVPTLIEQTKNDPGLQGEITHQRFKGSNWVGEEIKYSTMTHDPNEQTIFVTYINYVIVMGENYYVIQLGSLKEKEVEYAPVFQEMIRSFELLNSEVAAWKTYTVEKEFKVNAPASWEKLENSYLKLQVASKMEALLNVGTMPMPEGVTTLEGLVPTLIDQFKCDPGLQGEITHQRFQGSNWVGEEIKYSTMTHDPNEQTIFVTYINYIIVMGENYYIVQLGSLKEKEVEYAPIFQEMIKSFELLNSEVAAWKTYTVEKEFKVNAPSSWEQLENSYMKLQVGSKMEALLNVGTMPMPEGVTTLDELVPTLIEQTKNDPGLQGEITHQRFQGSNWVGEEIKYLSTGGTPDDRTVNVAYTYYIIPIGGNYYVVQLGALTEKAAEYAPIFQEMIKSFELLSFVSDVKFNSVLHQKDSITQSKNAVVSWEMVRRQSADDPEIKGYQVVKKENDATEPNEAEIPKELIRDTSVECQNLSSKNIYYVWARAVDELGRTGKWSMVKFSPPASEVRVNATSCLSEIVNNQPNYLISLALTKEDAATYCIERTSANTPMHTMNMVESELNREEIKYFDGMLKVPHEKYTYRVMAVNALGEKTPGTYCQVLTQNIKPVIDRAMIKAPRYRNEKQEVTFGLGPKNDLEGDQLEYQLYVYIAGDPSTAVRLESWQPTKDYQEVTYTFNDNSYYDWILKCVEKDGNLVPDREIVEIMEKKLQITATKPVILCYTGTNIEDSDKYTVTKGQPFKLEALVNPKFKVNNYSWKLVAVGKEEEAVTIANGATKNKLSYLIDELGSYKVELTVNVTTETGEVLDETGVLNFTVTNTGTGRLYTDEIWNRVHTVSGEVVIPYGYNVTITPGTKIRMMPGATIRVEGRLVAEGGSLATEKINFLTQFGEWNGIIFENEGTGLIKNTIISSANQGIVCNGYRQVHLMNDTFTNNTTGVFCNGGAIDLYECSFIKNEVGIIIKGTANPTIVNCTYEENGEDQKKID